MDAPEADPCADLDHAALLIERARRTLEARAGLPSFGLAALERSREDCLEGARLARELQGMQRNG